MIPSISTLFNVDDIESTVTDDFDYSAMIYDAGYGNVTAKLGNTTFHTNGNFDTNADIVLGVRLNTTFDLPRYQGNKIQPGSYAYTYAIQLVNEVLYKANVGSGYLAGTANVSPITEFDLDSTETGLQAAIELLLATLSDVRIGLYNSSNVLLATSAITAASDNQIAFESVTYSGTITKCRIIGTNIYTKTFAYLYENCPQVKAALCVVPDCFYSNMVVSDTTVYPANVNVTREITINYPTRANGTPVLSPVTTSNASITIGPNIWTGAYNIYLTSLLEWVQDDSLNIEQTITAYDPKVVRCDANLCKIAACVNSFRVKYMEAVRSGSRDRDLTNLTQQNFANMLFYMDYQMQVGCQDTIKASATLVEWATYLGLQGCDCGCGCSDSDSQTEPTEVFPLFSDPSQTNYLLWSTN